MPISELAGGIYLLLRVLPELLLLLVLLVVSAALLIPDDLPNHSASALSLPVTFYPVTCTMNGTWYLFYRY